MKCRFCENPHNIISKDTCCTGCYVLKIKVFPNNPNDEPVADQMTKLLQYWNDHP